MSIFDGIDQGLVRRFLEYHGNHPDVFEKFEFYAREMLDSGCKRISARRIVEQIRWFYDIQNGGIKRGEPFKINNDYSPLYARLLEASNLRYKDMFEKREMKACRRRISAREREITQ